MTWVEGGWGSGWRWSEGPDTHLEKKSVGDAICNVVTIVVILYCIFESC